MGRKSRYYGKGARGAENGPAGQTAGVAGSAQQESNHEPGLPILTYAEGRGEIQTNFLECKEKWSVYLKRTYGNAGRLLELGKHYEPEAVPPLKLSGLTDTQKEMELDIHKEAIKMRMRDIHDLRKDYPRIYAFLYGHMSTESRAKVKTVSNWADIERDNDEAALWKAMTETHMAAVSGSAGSDKSRVRDAYYETRQHPNESVADLKKKFDDILLVFDAVGQTRPPQEELAVDFIRKLDSNKFAGLRAELDNARLIHGTDQYPKTLVAAYELAVNYKVVKQVADHKMGVVPAATLSTAAFATNVSKPKKQKKSAKKQKEQKSAERKGGDGESSGLICWACGEPGHKLNDCPEVIARKSESKPTKKVGNHLTLAIPVEPGTVPYEDVVSYLSASSAGRVPELSAWIVGIDTMASDHVIANDQLLDRVWKSRYNIEISGVGGTIVTDLEGHLKGFGTVNVSSKGANLLSFARLSDDFDITWDQDRGVITVHTSAGDFDFKRDGNLYVCDMSRMAKGVKRTSAMVQTVQGNERLYTKRQVRDAERARELMESLGFVSSQDLIKLVKRGIPGCDVRVEDVHRAMRIYGESLGSLRGKTKRSKTEPVHVEAVPIEIDVDVTLHVDIMFVESIPFLICVVSPMSMVMVQLLGSRKLVDVRKALMHIIGKVRAEGFVAKAILTDGEGAVMGLTDELQLMGIIVNPSGAGSHVPVVENKIKTVKERVRGHINVLPFKLCVALLIWLVYYCVSRINLVPTSTMSTEYISPREAFTGMRMDYARDLSLKFGDYCEVHEQYLITNTMAPRTRPAIALKPKGNRQGSWEFFALGTYRILTRDHWTKLPMPDSVINELNAKAAQGKKRVSDDPVFTLGITDIQVEEGVNELVFTKDDAVKRVHESADAADFEPLDSNVEGNGVISNGVQGSKANPHSNLEPVQLSMISEGVAFADEVGNGEPVECPGLEPDTTSIIDISPSTLQSSSMEAAVGTVDSDGVTSVSEPVVVEPQRAGRGGRTVRRDYRKDAMMLEKDSRKWAWHITVNQALGKFRKEAFESICAELMQMHNKGVWRPVSLKTLSAPERKKIIRSSMFLKEKFSSTGEFQKLKARLVAGGHMQDRSIYSDNDTEAPTASLQSVYMVAAIAAHEGRVVVTADITGAYLNADMKKAVHMRLEPKLAEALAALEPSYREFINPDGTIVVTLVKALYGCVESARLWYDNISSLLKSNGFIQNARERCVFNKDVEGVQVTVCIYVDDLFITCKDIKVIDSVLSKLMQLYNDITIHRGAVHSYLGQTFDFSEPKKVKISMSGYVDDLLSEYNVEGCAATPATDKLFVIDATSNNLNGAGAEAFHSRVAKLLYLAKRVRPDILTTIAFLSTRVQAPTEQDNEKLSRLLRYINGTKDLGICLEAGAGITILAYVDASFAVHGDMKSHTGGVISLGKGPVFVRSSKQRLTSKSSTEAELIGVSDMLPQIIWTREFLQQQGYECKPAKIFQDNQSTIVLANKGFSTSDKTRHIGIRYYFVKDRIDGGEVEVEYLATEDMVADIMTKPLQGSLFRKLRNVLMNCE